MAETSENPVKREKSADLWEKSIVQAFRDMQWLLSANRSAMPDINVPFAGKIEAAFGDGVVAANERLFLLEFKASAAGKAAEWRDKKLSYQSLEQTVYAIRSAQEMNGMDAWFETSMRGHLFLYWSAEGTGRDARMIPGDLVVSSYLLDVARRSPIRDSDPCLELSAFNSIGVLQHGSSDVYVPMGQVLAQRLFDDTAKLVREPSGSHLSATDPRALNLGITPREMQGYVGWLLKRQDLRDLPINALLASRNGAICQHISHVDDLEDLLISLMHNPKPPRSPVSNAVEIPLTGRSSIVVPEPEEDAPSYGLW